MNSTLFASFADYDDAEKAIGAVMDHGISGTDVSMIAGERWRERMASYETRHFDGDNDKVDISNKGITTTTAADAGVGAAKGAGVGLGVGVLAALSAMFLPGIGLVIGGGALATALAGAAGAIGGGAIAGGVFGYLKDQGVPEDLASTYHETIIGGGVVLSISVPPNVNRTEIEAVLSKYNALNVNRYGAATLR